MKESFVVQLWESLPSRNQITTSWFFESLPKVFRLLYLGPTRPTPPITLIHSFQSKLKLNQCTCSVCISGFAARNLRERNPHVNDLHSTHFHIDFKKVSALLDYENRWLFLSFKLLYSRKIICYFLFIMRFDAKNRDGLSWIWQGQ